MSRDAAKDMVEQAVLPSLGETIARGEPGGFVIFWGSRRADRAMAAKVLAETLKFQLVQPSLGRSASKYIGETEKNLRSALDAASEASSVLFLDEADAIFGKRTGVKDSHDRYANIETSFLLQKMERVHGVVVLSADKLDDIDGAFAARALCIVCFDQ